MISAMHHLLSKNKFVLTEASIVERIRRSVQVALHSTLANAPLIYDPIGREIMAKIYLEYLDIARRAEVPALLMTPTWRTNADRVLPEGAGVPPTINRDVHQFMREVIDRSGHPSVCLAGMVGCRGDCYRPEEAVDGDEAVAFHRWQVSELVHAGVDGLIAQTLPSVREAIAIALAMAETALDYVISFVVDRNSRLLDGTLLTDAMDQVDEAVKRPPIGYGVNCSFPSFVQPEILGKRLVGSLLIIQGNGSSLSAEELEGATTLQQNPIAQWGDAMIALHKNCGVVALGGCCGTDGRHLEYLTAHLTRRSDNH
jgi:homocysteine S-methyltransferase